MVTAEDFPKFSPLHFYKSMGVIGQGGGTTSLDFKDLIGKIYVVH